MCLSTFNSLASSLKPYYYQNCITDHIPFSNLTNKEMQKLFNHVYNEKQNILTLPFDNNKDSPTEPDICKYYDQNSFIKFIENKSEKDLFFLHCNVRSLQKNLPNLQQYLSELKSTPDIVAITETRLLIIQIIRCLTIISKVMISTIVTLIHLLVELAYM